MTSYDDNTDKNNSEEFDRETSDILKTENLENIENIEPENVDAAETLNSIDSDSENYNDYMEEETINHLQDNNNTKDKSANKKLIPDTAPYHISYEIYSDAYKVYQKHYVFPKNRIMQLILLLLAVDFGYHGAVNPDNKLAFFLMVLCAALICVLWYNPRKMRRNVMDVIREMDGDEYVFSMDDEKMTFCTVPSELIQDVPDREIPSVQPTEIYYTKDLYVVEKEQFFLICRGKQGFFVLPKYALYDNQTEIVRSGLEKRIGKHFRFKI